MAMSAIAMMQRTGRWLPARGEVVFEHRSPHAGPLTREATRMGDSNSAAAHPVTEARPAPFAQVHKPVLYDRSLPDAAIRLYAVLSDHANARTGQCRLRRRTIATETGWSMDKVDRQIAVLTNAGHLVVGRGRSDRGEPEVNTYRLTHRAQRRGEVAARMRPPVKNKTLVNQSPLPPEGTGATGDDALDMPEQARLLRAIREALP